MHSIYTCDMPAVNATNWQSLSTMDWASGFLISDFLTYALSFPFAFADPPFPFVLRIFYSSIKQ
jgi:hypothetical protein